MQTVQIRLPDEILGVVEKMRRSRIDGADRSSIIRELLAEAIEARGEVAA